MKSINKALISATAIVALQGLVPAFAADEVYSNSFRAGSYTVFYHTHADDITGPYVPAGVNLKAKDLETLYVGYVRRLSPSFSLELALGYPPLNKVEGKGPAFVGSVPYNGQVVSTARWLSPAALLEYNFLSEDSKLRPFIGVGVNYTNFYDRKSTAQGNAGLGGPTKLSLTASVGPAATAGLAYTITPRWHVYGSYSIARVNTHVTADTEGVIRTTTLKFGPQTLIISGGYSFGR
jgi:outer membrane protein